GFVFTSDDPFTGIDLDHSRNPQTSEISERAQQILETFDSYTEVSPSGTGLHCIIKGKLPPGRRRVEGVEVYDSGRFFTITFAHISTSPAGIAERQNELNELVASMSTPIPATTRVIQSPSRGLSDDEVLTRARSAKNGDKFQRLFSGSVAGYPSQSEAEM